MARPNQLPPPGDWRIWLILAGRGFGKTRSVTEWARIMAQKMPGSRGAIVAATAADARDTVIEGDSGLLNISPPWERPHYSPTKRRVTWKNNSIASLFSADEPERLRGPQFHWAVCDELCLSEETLIDTEYGQRRIDEVQVGDRVWTRQGLRTVVHAWCSNESAEVYEVTMSNGQTLVGTENHPIWTQDRGFVPLSVLTVEDILLSPQGAMPDLIRGVNKITDRRPVFNLEVEGEHEYFANGVLTHNCAWRYPIAWDMLQFGLRLGRNPQVVIATTPKPVSHLKMLIKEAENPDSKILITRGDTFDNADNLAPTFLEKMVIKYEGTRLGEQELHAVLHEDAAGSLWKSWMFEWEYFRYIEHPIYKRVVVAIDPAIKSGGNGQREETLDEKVTETGIIVAGVDNRNHGYIIEDATISGSPRDWAQEAIYMYKKHKADRIVAEINNGGNMIENTLRTIDSNISFRAVSASRSKQTRAEPVVALYEQKRIHHRGVFADLETQMVQWEPGAKSPDRMDAAVWALTDLLIDAENDEVPMRQGRWK